MNVKSRENNILDEFILGYCDNSLRPPEDRAFADLLNSSGQIRKQVAINQGIRAGLKALKTIKVSIRFDQKMAARFALELEKESAEANRVSVSRRNNLSVS
jgi:hypothetical protein